MNAQSRRLYKLRKDHARYMEGWKADGKPTVTFKPPCGCAPIERTAPTRGGKWTTLFTCPGCGSVFHSTITPRRVQCGPIVAGAQGENA